MTTTPDSLDAAWADAESALPEGWYVGAVERDLWAMSRGVAEWFAWAGFGVGPDEVHEGDTGTTPIEALRSLAAKLRDRA